MLQGSVVSFCINWFLLLSKAIMPRSLNKYYIPGTWCYICAGMIASYPMYIYPNNVFALMSYYCRNKKQVLIIQMKILFLYCFGYKWNGNGNASQVIYDGWWSTLPSLKLGFTVHMFYLTCTLICTNQIGGRYYYSSTRRYYYPQYIMLWWHLTSLVL